jgi:hypothetical protein
MLLYRVESTPGTKDELWYRMFYPVTKIETFSLGFVLLVGKLVTKGLTNRC